MTSSRSSSSRALAAAAALLLACAHRERPLEAPRLRLALLPLENVTGGPAALRELEGALEAALARGGVDVVQGEPVGRFLARHRIRYTAGVDGATAAAARDELEVDALLAPWIQQYDAADPPRVAVTMRVVSAEEEPRLLWIGGVERTGADAPGLLGTGLVHDLPTLQRRALDQLVSALAAHLDGKGPRALACTSALGLGYHRRAPEFDPRRPLTIAVLPLVNRTERRGAGELVGLALARQLAAVPRVGVVEPGIVRDELLKFRVVMPEGPSLDDALVLNATVHADLILSGQVLQWDEGGVGPPRIGFTVTALLGEKRRVVWRSSSYATGEDRFGLFGTNRIRTSSELACQMARDVVQAFLER